MGKIIELSHDDVQNELAYALICETMEGAYWNSGRRRRMFSKAFTRSEQQRMPKPSMKHVTSKRFSAVLLLPRILS